MNHSPPSSTYDCFEPSITRSTPSAPIPACRSQRNRTTAGSRSPCRDPSGSGSSTKSFSVPCPFSQGKVPVLMHRSYGLLHGRRACRVLLGTRGRRCGGRTAGGTGPARTVPRGGRRRGSPVGAGAARGHGSRAARVVAGGERRLAGVGRGARSGGGGRTPAAAEGTAPDQEPAGLTHVFRRTRPGRFEVG